MTEKPDATKEPADKGEEEEAETAANIQKEEKKRLLDSDTKNPATTAEGKEKPEKLKKRKSSKLLAAPSSDKEAVPKEACPEFFGVKSYLHNFYETVTVKNPQLYEDIYEEDMAYMSHSRQRRRRIIKACWRFSLVLGALLLLLGLTFLLLGYLMPRLNVIVGYDEDMEIIDSDAREFNEFLDLARIIGLAIFCGGGSILGLALLVPVLINLQSDEEASRDSMEPFQVVIAPEEPPRSPTDKKIPATEELASIQPKREASEEVVMTNSGLCKAPVLMRVAGQ